MSALIGASLKPGLVMASGEVEHDSLPATTWKVGGGYRMLRLRRWTAVMSVV